MSIFIIFWIAIFAILFFALEMIFMVLSTVMHAVAVTLEYFLATALTTIAIGLGLYVIYLLIEGVSQEGILGILYVVGALAVIALIVIFVGSIVMEFILLVVELIVLAFLLTSEGLDYLSDLFETFYAGLICELKKHAAKC